MSCLSQLPERWIESQRIKLGCQQWLSTEKKISRITDLARLIQSSPLKLLNKDHYRVNKLKLLPVPTLDSLIKVDLPLDLIDDLNSALGYLKWNPSAGLSPLAGSMLVANRLSSGHLSGHEIIRLTQLELQLKLQDTPIDHKAIKALIDVFRQPNATSLNRLEAISNYGAVVCSMGWSLIENALLHNQFTWLPYVLFSPESANSTAVMLPVLIDVSLGNKGSLDDNVQLKKLPKVEHFVDIKKFEKTIERARVSATDLWRSNATSWPFAYQKAVVNCNVVVDISIAQAIVDPLFKRYGWKFKLEGSSCGAAISLSIMSHFINQSAINGICATGVINKRLPDPEDNNIADRQLGATHGLKSKIAAAAVEQFDKFLVVAKNKHEFEKFKQPPYTHVIRAKNNKLSDFANEVFGQFWRKHTYIRCPDVAENFKNAPSERALELRDYLKQNSLTIVKLDEKYSVHDVAQALKLINDDVRRTENSRFKINARIGTFTFVRTVPYEMNERFWWTIWETLGATRETYDKFRFVLSKDNQNSPARIFAKIMNRFTPSQGSPKRVPDILVIFGSTSFEDAQEHRLQTGPAARLRPKKIFRELIANAKNRWIEPTRTPYLQNHIGNTRIILLESGGEIIRNYIPKSAIDDEFYKAFIKLSIFRFGFTLRQASRHLQLSIAECSDILGKHLNNNSSEGTQLIGYSSSINEYYVRVTTTDIPASMVFTANDHLHAAESLIGYLKRKETKIAIDFHDAFSPWFLHEAQEHLNKARQLSGPARDNTTWEKSMKNIHKISNIGEPFGWSRIMWANRFESEQNPALVATLNEHLKSYGKQMHPLEWLLAAKYFHKVAGRGKSKLSTDCSIQADNAINKAHKACNRNRLNGKSEVEAAKFIVAAVSTCMIFKKYPGRKGLYLAKNNIKISRKLYKYSVKEFDDLEWFELIGDVEKNPHAALRWYQNGLWNSRLPNVARWHRIETLLKYLGTCAKLNKSPDVRVYSIIRNLSQRHWNKARPYKSTGLWQLPYVRERWQSGRKELLHLKTKADKYPSVIKNLSLINNERVAIIEIGSRACRLLVAELAENDRMKILKAGSIEVPLIEAIRRGGDKLKMTIGKLYQTINDFTYEANQLQIKKQRIFGTQGLRDLIKCGISLPSNIEVIDAEIEGRFSLTAAAKGMNLYKDIKFVVIDQGYGSIELVFGCNTSPISVDQVLSWRLGAGTIDPHSFSLKVFEDQVSSILEGAMKPVPHHKKSGLNVVVLGSTATQLAWRKVSAQQSKKTYRPLLVQGVKLSKTEVLQRKQQIASTSCTKLRYELAGLTVLAELLNLLGVEDFQVSAHGTRYGYAWHLLGNEEQDTTIVQNRLISTDVS